MPPSAADFWGERSAAVHDALQAPAEDPIDAGRTPARRISLPIHRRAAAMAALAIAGIASAFVVIGLGLSRSQPGSAGAPKMDVAAVVNGGISRMLQRGLALLDAGAATNRLRAASEHRARPTRRTAHARPALKPVHQAAHHRSRPAADYSPPSSANVAEASAAVTTTHASTVSATTTPLVHHSSSHSPTRASPASAAPVSPTGESGALGPIQSPNG